MTAAKISNASGPVFRTLFLCSGRFPAILLLIALLWPARGFCDLYVEFLIDRSGSMWASSSQDKVPKIVQVAEAVKRVANKLPPDVAMGLRVYPPPAKGAAGRDPGLQIPIDKEKREEFLEAIEASRLNPRGRGSLREQIERAFQDFPAGKDTKLLIVICDGADPGGVSFCEKALGAARPQGLRFYIISLNVERPSDRDELDCLSRQMDGKSIHLSSSDSLASTLLPIARMAHKDEAARQRRVAEERRRIEELLSKTRLKVEIHNTLDPFFADSIQIDQCLLDGKEVPLQTPLKLKQGEGLLLFDRAMAEGSHQLALRYLKWKDGKAVPSVEGILDVRVEEGKTTHVQCFPRGALFHWEFTFKTQTK